jgi:hypothetical protein
MRQAKKSNVADVVNGIEILNDMEVPERQVRPSYPFGDLKPGQSFIVECEDKKHEASIRSMAVGRNRKAKEQGRKDRFIVRRIPETDSDVGVWRVE